METPSLLLSLIVVWLAAKIAAETLQRLGQTAVTGELLAGVLVGPGLLGLVHPTEFLTGLADIGIVILLFEIGLRSDLDELLRSGVQSLLVALVGVVAPLLLGFALARWWGFPPIVSVFLGAALTATSVGVTARVLSDLGQLDDPAARVVMGAAVIDDVLGLLVLSIVGGLIRSHTVSILGIAGLLLKAALFLVIAIAVGVRLAPWFILWVQRMQVRGSLLVYAVLFCSVLAVLAELGGLAPLVGAFAAGLVLAKTERGSHIEDRIRPIADLFVPIFFVTTGMAVQLGQLHPSALRGPLLFAVLLTLVAIGSKLVAGLAVYQRDVRRWRVGTGLIPRGEVGLIFAAIGLRAAVIDRDLYGAVVLMIMLTTVIGPVWLRRLYLARGDVRGDPPSPSR
jgi:Kef-type K+ transport system membrane component KefB